MEVGTRVVRGPDWKWGNQDEGEGHVGTVVEIGRAGSSSTPEKTVVVQWDSGSRTNYRTGYQGAYDLRIIDNAPIGVRHPNISCNSCQKHGISGIRWKCSSCPNYDLCTSCYMADKHDLSHPFSRFDTSNSVGVDVPKRSAKNNSAKIQSKGIFVGARVVRGYDWDWDNQDGGDGKVGQVIDIRGWDNESRRSVANVMWSSGSTNVYRLGHKGKVDLKYTVESEGGKYYRDHLPILGQSVATVASTDSAATSGVGRRISGQHSSSSSSAPTSSSAAASSSSVVTFSIGDKVKVSVRDEDELKALQDGHGGWNPRMAQFIGRIGTVHRVTDHGDIRVQFDNCPNRWTFNPVSLIEFPKLNIGDMVRVIDDQVQMKELQKNHGEWIDQMKSILKKTGQITKVYGDGDIRVQIDGNTWTLNPMCVTVLTRKDGSTSNNNPIVPRTSRGQTTTTTTSMEDDDILNSLSPRLGHLLSEQQQQQDQVQSQAILSPLPSSSSILPPASSSSSDLLLTTTTTTAAEQQQQQHSSREPTQAKDISKSRVNGSKSKSTDVKKSTVGSPSSSSKLPPSSNVLDGIDPIERLRYLESKIQEIEETYSCGICMERTRNVVFLCGHGACVVCAQTLYTCHMCREPIARKINIY